MPVIALNTAWSSRRPDSPAIPRDVQIECGCGHRSALPHCPREAAIHIRRPPVWPGRKGESTRRPPLTKEYYTVSDTWLDPDHQPCFACSVSVTCFQGGILRGPRSSCVCSARPRNLDRERLVAKGIVAYSVSFASISHHGVLLRQRHQQSRQQLPLADEDHQAGVVVREHLDTAVVVYDEQADPCWHQRFQRSLLCRGA
jgi:hypothetical protein